MMKKITSKVIIMLIISALVFTGCSMNDDETERLATVPFSNTPNAYTIEKTEMRQ